MNNEEKILQLLTQMQGDIKELKTDVKGLKTDVTGLKADVTGLKADVTGLKADVTGLKADVAKLEDRQNAMQADVARLLYEIEPVVQMTATQVEILLERDSKITYLERKVNDHGDRIFALEQLKISL